MPRPAYHSLKLISAGLTLFLALTVFAFTGPAAQGSRGGRVAPVSLSLSEGTQGDALVVSGALPTRVRRPVVLQSSLSKSWSTTVRGRSTSTGRYSFTTTLPAAPGHSVSYRLFAPRVRVKGVWYAALTTPARSVRVTAQANPATTPQPQTVATAPVVMGTASAPTTPADAATAAPSVTPTATPSPAPSSGPATPTVTAKPGATPTATPGLNTPTALVLNAAPVTLRFDQTKRVQTLALDAVAGDQVRIQVTGLDFNGVQTSVILQGIDPAGVEIPEAKAFLGRLDLKIAATGTYVVRVSASGSEPGSVTLGASTPAQYEASINGPTVKVEGGANQRVAQVWFTAAPGDLPNVYQIKPFGTNTSVSLRDKDGLEVPCTRTIFFAWQPCSAGGWSTWAGGRYYLQWEAADDQPLTGEIGITKAMDPVGLNLNGSPVDVTVTRPGESARLTINAKSGQRIRIAAVSDRDATSEITDPGGTVVGASVRGRNVIELGPMDFVAGPEGEYTLLITPFLSAGDPPQSFRVWASTPLEVSAAVNGAPVHITNEGSPGRIMKVGFDGVKDQVIAVDVTPNDPERWARAIVPRLDCTGIYVEPVFDNAGKASWQLPDTGRCVMEFTPSVNYQQRQAWVPAVSADVAVRSIG